MRKHSLPLAACALFFAGVLHAQSPAPDLAGHWQGTFDLGVEPRRAVVELAPKDGGGWAAKGFYIEFAHDYLEADSVVLNASGLRVTVKGGKAEYEGKVSADGASISGTLTLNGQRTPLELRRASGETAWRVPFLYQYHMQHVTYARPSPDEAKIAFNPRLAVDYLEQSTMAWTAEWGCVACHTNGSYMVVRPMLTAQLGQPNSEQRAYFVSALKQQLYGDPDDPHFQSEPTQVVYIAAGLAIWDAHVTHRLSPETEQALGLMFKLQRPTGDWFIEDDNNPPLESNTYQLATVAARAIGNAPGWLARQRGTPLEPKIRLVEDFLRAQRKPQGDYDRTDLLWSAAELPGLLNAQEQQELVAMIFRHQKPDGGWSMRTFARPEEWGKGNRAEKLRAELDFEEAPSDGHMTGLAIIALRKAGVPASDPRIQRGVAWLLTNQRASGRWWTHSLNRDGFQFITYSGTAYPLLALSLCNALPSGLQPEFRAGVTRQDHPGAGR